MSGILKREAVEEDTARSMADALTYLCRVAREAGYDSVVGDILALRDKLTSIASDEEATRRRRADA